MDLKEYQAKATATAQPRAYDHQYLIPMIVGETGELFGKRGKAYWHGWGQQELNRELALEYGDIAWGTAILLHTEGVDDVAYHDFPAGYPSMWGTKPDGWSSLLHKAHSLHTFHTEDELHHLIKGEAERMWKALEYYCCELTGYRWAEVLQMNLDKLASRAQRGVLQGSGDHR